MNAPESNTTRSSAVELEVGEAPGLRVPHVGERGEQGGAARRRGVEGERDLSGLACSWAAQRRKRRARPMEEERG